MNNNMLKSKLVVLPVNQKVDKAAIYRIETSDFYSYKELDDRYKPYAHLYLISDREIKEGDWVLVGKENHLARVTMTQCKTHKACLEVSGFNAVLKSVCKKIEATTNPELLYNPNGKANLGEISNIPQIGEPFIKAYIESYNNGKPITEVMIEMEEYTPDIVITNDLSYKGYETYFKVKTRSDNTVIIHHIKDNFTRDEVIQLLKRFRAGIGTILDKDGIYTKEFIENNL